MITMICDVQSGIKMFGGEAPSYTPPPAPPPQAAPATLANPSVVASAAARQNQLNAGIADVGASGSEGVAPSSVTTAKANLLGGVS